MTATFEIPFPPGPHEAISRRPELPVVAVEPRWEYREIVREAAELPSEADLNVLGDERWELVGVAPLGSLVHFYFKRERLT
jgi:hypothetical protein